MLRKLRDKLLHPAVWAVLFVASLVGAGVWLASGCSGWDPSEPFMRNAPQVDEAIRLMDAGEHARAGEILEEYLGTGPCSEGDIAVPPEARKKHDGSFDLGLVLFHVGEKYGARFGEEEENPDGGPEPPEVDPQRVLQIKCSQIIVQAISGDRAVPPELRARALYLGGNLEFLQREYENAVEQYDLALQIVPGITEDADGDKLGRDVAWNRAIALRRLMENDAGAPEEPEQPDAGDDSGEGDGGGQDDAGDQQQGSDGGQGDGEQDAGADQGPDAGADGGDGEEPQAGDQGDQDPDMGEIAESGEADDAERRQMMSILDELEDAPTYQQEEARQKANEGRRPVMEDK